MESHIHTCALALTEGSIPVNTEIRSSFMSIIADQLSTILSESMMQVRRVEKQVGEYATLLWVLLPKNSLIWPDCGSGTKVCRCWKGVEVRFRIMS